MHLWDQHSSNRSRSDADALWIDSLLGQLIDTLGDNSEARRDTGLYIATGAFWVNGSTIITDN